MNTKALVHGDVGQGQEKRALVERRRFENGRLLSSLVNNSFDIAAKPADDWTAYGGARAKGNY